MAGEDVEDFKREINEAWQILDEEKRALREAYAQESEAVEREAAEDERKLLNQLQNLEGDMEQAVENERQRIQRDMETLEQDLVEDRVDPAELEQKWVATVERIEEFYEHASQTEVSDNEADQFWDDIQRNLESIMQTLRPLVQDDDARGALEDLRTTIQYSINTHQQIYEMRQLLIRARQSVELQERLVEAEHFDALNEEIMNIGAAEENLEQEAERIEEAERQLLDEIEQAGDLIQKLLSVDQEIIETMKEEVGEVGRMQSAMDRVLGRGTGEDISSRLFSPDNLIMMVRALNAKDPGHTYAGIADFIQDDFKPLLEAVQQEEQRRLTEEYRLTEELEEYVREHRDLLGQESDMVPEEPLIPEEEIEDALQGAPQGTERFINILENLIEEKERRELLRELRDIKTRYQEVYQINELEEHDIEEFDKRVRKVEQAIETVGGDWARLRSETLSDDLSEAQGQPNSPSREFSNFMNGKRNYFGLRNIPPMIQTIEQDLEKIFEEDEQERNAFQQVHQEIQDVKGKASEFLEMMEELESLEREFSTGDAQARNMQQRRRVYFQVFKTASIAIADGDQQQLRQQVREVRQYIQQLEQELQQCDQIMQEEIKEEDLERQGLEQAAQDIRQAVRELEEDFRGGDPNGPQIPGTVEEELDKIDAHLENIVEKIEGQLIPAEEQQEQAEQQDETTFEELEEGFEEGEDAFDPDELWTE